MAASYPSSVKVFPTHVNVTEVIDAGHPNSIQDEVVAIEATLGATPTLSTTPSPSGTFNGTSTNFSTVADRIANVETGVVADVHTQYVRKTGDSSNIITAGSSSNKPLIVKGAASQTANLQEWQNNSGTALANVDASGNVTATAFVKAGGTSSQFLKADGSVDSASYITGASVTSLTGTTNQVAVSASTGAVTVSLPSAVTISGAMTANSFVKSGGTSAQFLKANGSVDSNTYLTGVTAGTGLTGGGTSGTVTVGIDSTVATLTGTQTLTNKTIADPVITTSVNAQTGTTYTPVITDAKQMVTLSNASAITVTIPPNSSVSFATGSRIDFIQKGAGQVTFAQGSGVTIRSTGATPSAPKLRLQYSAATAWYEGNDIWYIVGDLT